MVFYIFIINFLGTKKIYFCLCRHAVSKVFFIHQKVYYVQKQLFYTYTVIMSCHMLSQNKAKYALSTFTNKWNTVRPYNTQYEKHYTIPYNIIFDTSHKSSFVSRWVGTTSYSSTALQINLFTAHVFLVHYCTLFVL